MEITFLADYPEHVETLARWQHLEWSHISPEKSLKSRNEELRRTLNRGEVPTTVVAAEDGEIRGAVSLTLDEMETHTEWNPWLANLYIPEDYRGQGIAKRLVERIIDEAESLGFNDLYLFAYQNLELFEEMGWEPISEETYHGHETTVMKRKLRRDRYLKNKAESRPGAP